MRIPSTQRSVPGDWSKGFVEHLRTVHFALLSISVALILLLLSKPYDARTAVSELNQIVSLKKFLLGPTEGWGWQTVETVPIASGEAIFYAPSFGATVGKSSTKGGIPFEGKTLTFRVSQPNVYTCERRSISDEYRQLDSSAFPNNVKEFSTWWNKIAQSGLTLAEIRTIGEGMVWDLDKHSAPLHIVSSLSGSGMAIELSMRGFCPNENSKSSDPGLTSLVGTDGNYQFDFSVEKVSRVVLTADFLQQRFPRLRNVSFEACLPNLAKAGRGREEHDFDTLATVLNQEATRGSEEFEVFGIKLPSEQVTGWGLVILIGVQLYLVMYLKQLSNKLTPDDPGWHMPWMAMDQSLLARALLFLTVVVLPSSAGLLVSIRATRQIVPNGLKWKIIETFRSISVPDRIELALMILGFVVCVTLSIVCWKYRPKLNDPKAPAELFE